MTTVIDQARPWLTPRKTLAVTTQPQLGATAINSGTGSASAQPSSSSRRRPTRSASAPAPRFGNDLASPKATMNERTAALEPTPKSSLPISGSVERSSPTIAPTKALMATSRLNWAAFSRRPSRTGAAPLTPRLSLLALLDVDEQRRPDDVRGDPGDHDAPGERIHGYRRTTLPERFAATISAWCSGAGGMSFSRLSTKASSEPSWRALLLRRSKPIVEAGLPDSRRPQTEPE